jgi:hypothetical protein
MPSHESGINLVDLRLQLRIFLGLGREQPPENPKPSLSEEVRCPPRPLNTTVFWVTTSVPPRSGRDELNLTKFSPHSNRSATPRLRWVMAIGRTPSGNKAELEYHRVSLLWVVALLLLCIAHGVWTVSGLTYPPDVDSLRDMGFMQGILNGDLVGDPAYAGEIRWYPPLVPALASAASRLLGIADLPAFWVQAGPWINLLVPAAFFLAARRMLGSTASAAVALTVFVLFDSAVSRPQVTGGYTPWPLTPNISQSLFFLTLWLILARQGSRRWLDAAFVGGAIGVTFLAHPVPAIILTLVVAAVAFGVRGLHVQTVAWLAVVAVVQLAVMSPYLAPIALHYPGGIVHTKPSFWLDPLMAPYLGAMARAALLNMPGVLALIGTVFLYRRGIRLERGSAFALGGWIILCVLVLGRHYACGVGARATGADVAEIAACRAFVVPVHHYHLYLQTAWAILIGFVGWHLLRLLLERGTRSRIGIAAVVVLVLAAVCGWSLLDRKFDAGQRQEAAHADGGGSIDLDAYRWILANTRPNDTFATPLAFAWADPAAFAVYAAGRKLVAAPLLHSNPYVLWEPREARRRQILEAAAGGVPATPLCRNDNGTLWVLEPIDSAIDEGRIEAAYSTGHHIIYRVRAGLCASKP